MQSRSAHARRHGGLLTLVVFVALSLVSTATGAGYDRRPVASADTWYQTIRFTDGASARLTISTRATEPRPGEGVDLGTVYASGPSGTATAALPATEGPLGSPGGRIGTNAGGTGSQTVTGWVTYSNYVGVQLWRWIHQISWSYGGYKVTRVYNQFAGSTNSCCLWEYHGTQAQSHAPAGGPNFTAYAQGKYKACVTSILCDSRSPWVWMQGNGNGILTGFSWGNG